MEYDPVPQAAETGSGEKSPAVNYKEYDEARAAIENKTINSGSGAPIVLRFENWALNRVKIDWVSPEGALSTYG